MKRTFFLVLLSLSLSLSHAQTGNNNWARAFPITGYLVELNDSLQLVQVYLAGGPLIKERQGAVLKGVYETTHADTMQVGAGRCQLIKGDYYYFSINHKQSGRLPKEGDLLYVLTEMPAVYNGQLIKLASHYIELQTVYEEALFDRSAIFSSWTTEDEKRCIDSMQADIRFTGNHFLKNEPSMNVKIPSGKFKDQMVLNVMTHCNNEDVKNFLDYMIVRPRLYAGRKWKVAEIFATWLSNGTPTVIW